MKKIMTLLAVLSLTAASVAAQNIPEPEFEIYSSGKIDSDLRLAFPMHFGFTSPMSSSIPFPDTKLAQSFFYALDVASIKISSASSPFSATIGIRLSFQDYSFQNTDLTYRRLPIIGIGLTPILLESAKYDGKKSKIHASYVGVPLMFAFKAGQAKIFAGAGADYMFHGYTKYRSPGYRQDFNELFNSFHAYAEAGFCFGAIGVFANYSITPVFSEAVSDCRTLTFGLVLGM